QHGFGMKLEAVTPFLGKYLPFVGHCCQTCTPKSWESLFHRSIMDLGFCNLILVKEENTRFRGWLFWRLCYFLWSLEQHIPPCQDAPEKIMESTGVQNIISGRAPGGAGEGQGPSLVKKEVQRILGHSQTPPHPFLLRLFSRALLWFLNCLFLNVQLHRGQMKMVHKATQAGSLLILLSTHKSLLDGILLPFVLLSQGLGMLRVAWDPHICSPILRSKSCALRHTGRGPWANLSLDSSEGVLARAVQGALAPLGLWTGALAALRITWGLSWGFWADHLRALSWQEYTIDARSCWDSRQTLEQLLQPIVLGQCTVVPDTEKEQEWTPVTGPLLALKQEDQLLVRNIPSHLPASVASSVVISTAIRAMLLLFRHRKVLGEFSWLTEEMLLRGFDMGFSGQLRCLVQHTLSLLCAHVALLRLYQGNLLVVPRPGPGLVHLAHLSAELLPAFLSEAVGACAMWGLLAGRVPPEGPWELQGIKVLSQNDLYCQILLLLPLLPRDLLLLHPCQSSYCYCQDQPDRVQWLPQTPGSWPACDTRRQRLSAELLWKPSGDFTDSDSDNFEEAEGRYFRVSQSAAMLPSFLFLCHLLSLLLKAFAQAATFLWLGLLSPTESGYVEQLFQFLQATAQEEGFFDCADPNLAVSAVWTFSDLGQTPSPVAPMLHLFPTFASWDNQEKLEPLIRQFICG
uniref:Glycerol-3-phosphate acyltransferase 2, mitochondrial n=1 Tax=Sus scrofa TaxID=9823 RepID=A0A8D1Z7Z9_PIG